MKNTSPYLMVETEALVYTIESLVAEFGGTLSLFVGFSFMNLWDVFELVIGVFPALAKFSAQISKYLKDSLRTHARRFFADKK